jgi:hypothetical protein
MKLSILRSLAVMTAFVSVNSIATAAKASPSVLVNQLMLSAKVDLTHDYATLPLHLGHMKDGRKVWFVLTDTNDAAEANRLGLVHASQLGAVLNAKSTRQATVDSQGNFTFEKGTVDFSPKRSLIPGDSPNFFPPKAATPGSVGDAAYSPFVRISGTNIVYNAPIVAFDTDATQISFCNGHVNYDLVHDRAVKICPAMMEASIQLGHGFAGGDQVVYLSFDSNNSLPATMEAATYTPATQDLITSGASETLYAFANGATGVNNPDRQGFNSALAGEGSPLNILGGLTINSHGYTPLWDINVAVWSNQAAMSGQRRRLTSGDQADSASQSMLLTNPMGKRVGTLGLLVNCPVIGFVK